MSQTFPPAKPYDSPTEGGIPRKSGCGCGCLSCLGVFLGLLVVCAIGCGVGLYTLNKRMPKIIRDRVDEVMTDAQVDEETKREIMTQVERVTDGYQDGRVSFQNLAEMAERFQNSPLVPILIVKAVSKGYIDRSGLDEEEKKQGKIEFSRVARGMYEKKIQESDVEELMKIVTEDGPQSSRKMKNVLSDAELRECIAECKRLADEHGIPDEEYAIDPAKELKRIIDEVLGNTGAAIPQDFDIPIPNDPNPDMPNPEMPDSEQPDDLSPPAESSEPDNLEPGNLEASPGPESGTQAASQQEISHPASVGSAIQWS